MRWSGCKSSSAWLDLRVFRHLLAGLQPHVGFLPVRAVTGEAAAAAELTDVIHGSNVGHLDAKQLLDGGFDFRLVGLLRHFEAERALVVLFGHALLGDDRPL